jgi:protein-disulfide isomerase
VTIVKAFDFACPACMQMNDHLKKLVKEHEGKVRIVYKNFVIHENARPAHLGGCAAAKQGKYLAFKEAFWEKGYKPFLQSVQARKNDNTTMEPAYVVKIAGETGLDEAKFKSDMESAECKKLVDDDYEELSKFEISGTPTLYINGTHWGQDFGQIIEEKVKIAEASGVAKGEFYQKEIMAKGEKKFRSKRTPR